MGEAQASESGKRLDAFVDAAFAFAVTLLVISGGQAPASLAQLVDALARIPAFAASFALTALFWSHHRAFGRLTARRDGPVMWLSLAIVFLMLVFVFPLRLLCETALGRVSGGRLPGGEALGSFTDLQTLYLVYGAGFGLMSGLYALLFATAARAPDVTADARREAVTSVRIWGAIAGLGALSAASAALVDVRAVPWLPGVIYALAPVAVWLAGGWRSSASTTSSSKVVPPTVKLRTPTSTKPRRR